MRGVFISGEPQPIARRGVPRIEREGLRKTFRRLVRTSHPKVDRCKIDMRSRVRWVGLYRALECGSDVFVRRVCGAQGGTDQVPRGGIPGIRCNRLLGEIASPRGITLEEMQNAVVIPRGGRVWIQRTKPLHCRPE